MQLKTAGWLRSSGQPQIECPKTAQEANSVPGMVVCNPATSVEQRTRSAMSACVPPCWFPYPEAGLYVECVT